VDLSTRLHTQVGRQRDSREPLALYSGSEAGCKPTATTARAKGKGEGKGKGKGQGHWQG